MAGDCDAHSHRLERPLAGRMLFQTRDVDEARARVARKFCDHRLVNTADRERFHAVHHHLRGAAISLNYMTYGAQVRIEPGNLETFYLIQIPLKGSASVSNGGMRVASDRRVATILNPDRHTAMAWSTGCEQALIQIDRQILCDFAAEAIGRPLDVPLVFDAAMRTAEGGQARWRRCAMALFAAATHESLFDPANRAHLRAVEMEFMAMLIASQPSNISHFLDAVPYDMPIRHFRLADEFIRGHAADAITLGDIAAAARTSPRTLQLAYRKAYGCTPMQALRRERLLRARLQLVSGDGTVSISAFACQWGFFHFGRFARQYSNAFGELPHETRAKWRGGEPASRSLKSLLAMN